MKNTIRTSPKLTPGTLSVNREFLKLNQSVTKLTAGGKKWLAADRSISLMLPVFSDAYF